MCDPHHELDTNEHERPWAVLIRNVNINRCERPCWSSPGTITQTSMRDHVWSSPGTQTPRDMRDHVWSSPVTRKCTGMRDHVQSSSRIGTPKGEGVHKKRLTRLLPSWDGKYSRLTQNTAQTVVLARNRSDPHKESERLWPIPEIEGERSKSILVKGKWSEMWTKMKMECKQAMIRSPLGKWAVVTPSWIVKMSDQNQSSPNRDAKL